MDGSYEKRLKQGNTFLLGGLVVMSFEEYRSNERLFIFLHVETFRYVLICATYGWYDQGFSCFYCLLKRMNSSYIINYYLGASSLPNICFLIHGSRIGRSLCIRCGFGILLREFTLPLLHIFVDP
ncbi:hypothetical protein AMTRI_Chr12g238740 [Amborella trichopoda]